MSEVNPSSHPEFPNGAEVVNTLSKSRYFGQRGTVYGSGPSKKNPNKPDAVIYVKWPNGDTYMYFPKSLALAPKKESEYYISKSRKGGKVTTIHEVPAEKRFRPTIHQRVAAERKEQSK